MARTVAVITSADAATMWLRPYLYPLRGNSRYADPQQRIYMSATIGDQVDRPGSLPVVAEDPVAAAVGLQDLPRVFRAEGVEMQDAGNSLDAVSAQRLMNTSYSRSRRRACRLPR